MINNKFLSQSKGLDTEEINGGNLEIEVDMSEDDSRSVSSSDLDLSDRSDEEEKAE